MELLLRPAAEDDYEGVNAVFADELAHHVSLLPDRFQPADPVMPRDWFLEVLANPNKMLIVAEAGGRLVGQILIIDSVNMDDPIYRPRRYLDVDELAVLAEYRRQGIGRRLMQAAEQFAAESGIPTVELNVWEANPQALSFYERLGYRTVRRRMARDLT
ncbi:MAG: GNAT family N-acetyltransferase [Chloroflexota bacterium]|nr:MAG: GNAT family N-acetyltransferase [Chloroflexota bacterium]